MAYYKWLVDDKDAYTGEEWVHAGEWSGVRSVRKPEEGWHLYTGSDLCKQLPWHKMPVALWLVETEGEVKIGDYTHRAEQVKLVSSYGILRSEMVSEIAYDWLEAQYQSEMIQPLYGSEHSTLKIKWVEKIMAELRSAIDGGDMPKDNGRGWAPLGHAVRAVEFAKAKNYADAWINACRIPIDCDNRSLRLEMGRRMTKRLDK